jgi:hypothetical protein
MVRATGVEPITFGFGDRRSIQLSYARSADTIAMSAPWLNSIQSASLRQMRRPFRRRAHLRYFPQKRRCYRNKAACCFNQISAAR